MGGLHFTIIGALVTVALGYWAIRYSQGAWTLGSGAGTAVGNVGRAFTKDPGSAK